MYICHDFELFLRNGNVCEHVSREQKGVFTHILGNSIFVLTSTLSLKIARTKYLIKHIATVRASHDPELRHTHEP